MNDIAQSPVLSSRDARGVVTITMNRPLAFNALSEELIEALQREIEGLAGDETVRVLVLAANGRAFCAGHDLREMRAKPSLCCSHRALPHCPCWPTNCSRSASSTSATSAPRCSS